MKKTLSTLFVALFATACANTEQPQLTKIPEISTPQNIIMIVGDGMGPAYTTAYRYYMDDPATTAVEQTVLDRHLIGMSSTYPARVSGYVTDSAASATALSSGIKTYNGAIGLDENKKPVETVLERAKTLGKKTGVVVTSQVNHATPASYLTHNESRKNYNAIADSYIDNGIKADVILGGGWSYFIREERNLVDEFKQAGFHYVDNYAALNTLPKDKAVLGLFADKGLPWALDDSNKYRLSAMTKAATAQLENQQGYFLLVEASQIDWGGHGNDIAASIAEMDDLAKTVEYLETYVKNNPDTLVILTADHSTGGFTLGANGKYAWQPDVLKTMKMSAKSISSKLLNDDLTRKMASDLFNFAINRKELQQLQQAKYNANEKLEKYQQLTKVEQEKVKQPLPAMLMHKAVCKIIDARTNTGWTTGGHTGVDVPVFAFGHSSELFSGKIDNTDIAKSIFTLLGPKH